MTKKVRAKKQPPKSTKKKKSVHNRTSITTSIPEDITHGTILSIDPGTKYMGWAITRLPDEDEFLPALIDRGTIFRTLKGTASTVDIVSQAINIWDHYEPDVLVMEDYTLRRGRNNGVFAIPGIISILKYEWFLRTGDEAIVVPAATWKTRICNNPGASKSEVRDVMARYLGDLMDEIIKEYAELRGTNKDDTGEQDCIDAIAIGLYGCSTMHDNRENAYLEKDVTDE